MIKPGDTLLKKLKKEKKLLLEGHVCKKELLPRKGKSKKIKYKKLNIIFFFFFNM
jgi:lipopolysaccharide export system protein LptC